MSARDPAKTFIRHRAQPREPGGEPVRVALSVPTASAAQRGCVCAPAGGHGLLAPRNSSSSHANAPQHGAPVEHIARCAQSSPGSDKPPPVLHSEAQDDAENVAVGPRYGLPLLLAAMSIQARAHGVEGLPASSFDPRGDPGAVEAQRTSCPRGSGQKSGPAASGSHTRARSLSCRSGWRFSWVSPIAQGHRPMRRCSVARASRTGCEGSGLGRSGVVIS